ncbi:MAG: prolyl oligopeptidase family serine peptidase [Planctomycetota bacterium]|nr:prolyl oligopeptidase family serine peptidase [Planctomycetota bacterium]
MLWAAALMFCAAPTFVAAQAQIGAREQRPGHTHEAELAKDMGALEWPGREAIVVREVEVGPWSLHRIGSWETVGGLPADRDAAAFVAEKGGLEPETIRFEQAGAIVVRMPAGELLPTAGLAGKPVAACEVLSASRREDGDADLERTAFVLYEPRRNDTDNQARGVKEEDSPAGGLVVLLPGMFGTPEPVIDSMVGQLRDRGWHVLRMLTHSSRFTERAEFVLAPGGGIADVAAQVAEVLGDRAAECAFAVEKACEFFAISRPTLPIDRRVAFGMSGGGMVLPTVVAREPDAYKAAVFVGAGCDFAAIAMDSNYAEWIDAVRVSWASDPTEADRTRFTDAYLDAATLDSYHTALFMRDIPALMLHGISDRAVPAATGDLLWHRLGKPERWTVPAGHEVLFLAYLPARAADVLDWMEQATGSSSTSPAPSP